MSKKLVISLLLVNLILLSSVSLSSLANNQPWWDDDWSFNQEIYIPIDTSDENAKFQPIDVRVEFDHPCWAKNEMEHSVRVIFQNGDNVEEIESQIYDLIHGDNDYITACSLVFLIPEEANGGGRYYIYYDDEEKNSLGYMDHIEIKESYYYYEPILGYFFESHYYEIIEDGTVVYAISQDGERVGVGIAQQVMKLKSISDKVVPSNSEAAASFDFWYYYGQGIGDHRSTSEQLISKNIVVDGNLMVECSIVSGTDKGDVQTAATYRYYYCPHMENKRLCVHVKHEIVKKLTVATGTNFDGVYGSIQCGKMKSNPIQELNFGEILPYLHVYTEQEVIQEYPVNTDPEYIPHDWHIPVLTTEDDIDLGSKAWVSFDEGETGTAHALILDSNSVVTSGTDEQDGVQVKAYESDYPHLPGFESNTVAFQYTRNSYEKGFTQDLEIPEDFIVEYDAEFFSTKTGGYNTVNKEADIFQSLVKMRPSLMEEISSDDNQEGTCSLEVSVHLASSMPMGSILSLLTGKNFPYISAELYRDDVLLSTGIGGRLPTNPFSSFEDTKLIDKIKLAWGIFDWRNSSFFKKIRFENLYPSRYLIKIYKENPVFGKERKYIGYKIIDVAEDTKTHVFCKHEGRLQVSVFEQKDKGVEDAKVWLMSDNIVIAEDITDQNGLSTIKAPCNPLENYILKIVYKGFVIHKEFIKLGYVRSVIPVKKSVNIELYDFTLKVTDTWGLTSEIELNSIITSDEMEEPLRILGEKISHGSYLFPRIYPGTYHIELTYKSFVLKESVQISAEEEISLVFPAEYTVKTSVLDSRGNPLNDAKILVSRASKKIEKYVDEDGFLSFSLPPSVYTVTVCLNDDVIGMRKITVLSDRTIDLITNSKPIYPIVITGIAGFFAVLFMFFAFKKKDILVFLKVTAMVLAIVALIYPWWGIHGSTSNVETFTSMYTLPVKFVTITIYSNVIAGELVSLPEIFVGVMNLLPLLTFVGCILIISSIVFKQFDKKRLSLLSLSSASVVLIGSLLTFSYAMSEIASVGVGGFLGSGNLDITIPGEGTYENMFCSWGPGIGLYLYVLSAIITLFIVVQIIRKMLKR
ncbi:hypothetical protein MBGDN05_00358 [Thermoplasmatales archaeon SCGC AB-539-N05]|nr:hypothetical protein MBGDN05_00358 [Thermoplasmatales archaeon SCGC AB-539-N05]ENO12054.1 hypothetical protein MBGDC06_00301 [Thermoplasmatales archaeon SCGC AB-539-C06]